MKDVKSMALLDDTGKFLASIEIHWNTGCNKGLLPWARLCCIPQLRDVPHSASQRDLSAPGHLTLVAAISTSPFLPHTLSPKSHPDPLRLCFAPPITLISPLKCLWRPRRAQDIMKKSKSFSERRCRLGLLRIKWAPRCSFDVCTFSAFFFLSFLFFFFFFWPDTYFALLCCCLVKEQTSKFKTQGKEMVETEA